MEKTEGGAQGGSHWRRLIEANRPPDFDASAKKLKAFERSGGISSASVLLRVSMGYALDDDSLDDVAAEATNSGVADLTGSALYQRLVKAKDWFAHLVGQELLRGNLRTDDERPLTLALIEDGTGISVPGSKGTNYRVHMVMDLAGEFSAKLELTDKRGGERLDRFTYPEGSLVMADRIYGSRKGIAVVWQAKAHVLVRLQWKAPLQDGEGNRLNLVEVARRCPQDGWLDVPVSTVPDADEKLPAVPARLIIARKSQKAAEEARRKLRQDARKDGYTPSAEALEAQDYIFLLTTMSAEALPADIALGMYRLRWRVETGFKRQKSIMHLDEIRARKDGLARAVLYIKLLAMLWTERAIAQWETGFMDGVPNRDAVMPPRWRMAHRLWDSLKRAVDFGLGMDDWLNAPAHARGRLIEPPRKRTLERNLRIRPVLNHLGIHG